MSRRMLPPDGPTLGGQDNNLPSHDERRPAHGNRENEHGVQVVPFHSGHCILVAGNENQSSRYQAERSDKL